MYAWMKEKLAPQDQQDQSRLKSILEHGITLMFGGDSNAGKTNLVARIVSEPFTEYTESTIAQKCHRITVNVDGNDIVVKIWDVPGDERYFGIAKRLSGQCDGVILVYDASDRKSFDCVTNWLGNLDLPRHVWIIANKCDLEERCISREEGELFAHSKGRAYYEASAKNDDNNSTRDALESFVRTISRPLLSSHSRK